jgi:hypothetical protein
MGLFFRKNESPTPGGRAPRYLNISASRFVSSGGVL